MSTVITMTGGSPWGFKMTGGKDFRLPLAIGKVSPGGKASKSGVVEGHLITRVNGEEFTNLTHHEAQNKIKSSGITLTLELSKPKPKSQTEPIMTSQPIIKIPTNENSTPIYKPNEHGYNKYSEQSDWQKNNQSQSPAMQKAYHKSVRAPALTVEAPTLSITPEIKEMILDEEKNDESALRVTGVKTWPTHNGSSPPTSVTPTNNGPNNGPSNGNHSQAAANIGKFIQGPGAIRSGEPSFSKPLQDISSPLGEPAVLEVRISQVLPTPSVHWYHDNRPARESKDKDIRFLSNGPVHTVVLGELTPEVLGTYTCTIMNKHGSASCRCVVAVKSDGHQPRKVSTYQPPSRPTPVKETKRIIPSTSMGLYSTQNVQETYEGQTSKPVQRTTSEESEVLRALRDDCDVTTTRKTRSMKYLEETLLPESEDL